MKDCQLVAARKDGRRRYYEVSRQEAVEMLSLADECIRRNVESVRDCDAATAEGAEES